MAVQSVNYATIDRERRTKEKTEHASDRCTQHLMRLVNDTRYNQDTTVCNDHQYTILRICANITEAIELSFPHC
ncbi:hypothetical protein TNCV_2572071 [Trichonephila clavipes]|nr:hypothetical protein TNCV_2572071 [Trichonephila clavipes]